ncbi:hypothetical protein D3C81_169810 [compost metagenome]
MSNYTAADMSTAAANGHRDGYQAGYADAVKAVEVGKDAAAQEAGPAFYLTESAWNHILAPMTPSRDVRAYRHGFDHGDMKLIPFYAAPVAAAPVEVERAQVNLDAGWYARREQHAQSMSYAGVADALEALERLRTPAAPGVDLEPFREAVEAQYSAGMEQWCGGAEEKQYLTEHRDRLLAMIDASPKGGDVQDAARYRWLKSERVQLWRDTLTGAPVSCSFDFDEPGHDVDAAIDAAMQATSAEVGE